MISREILRSMACINWHQPATALFRAVEVTHLLRSGVLPISGRVLDLGCGDGRLTAEIHSGIGADWILVGVDRDPQEVYEAETLGLYDRVHVASADRIPELDSAFDLVFSNSVLEHVENLPGALAEAARLLKPGGQFVATVPSEKFRQMLRGPGRLGRFATGTADRLTYEDAIDRRVAHVTYWSPEEWRDALGRVGLRLAASSYYMNGAELRRWEYLSNLTAGIAMRLFTKATHPIEVQRKLGWRRSSIPSPLRLIGASVVRLAAVGLGGTSSEDGAGGSGACLLLVATRTPGESGT